MDFPIDSYEIKARYAPALLLSLPILITFWTCFQPEVEAITKAISAILSGGIFYAVSTAVRSRGFHIQPTLWQSWGGAPSTIIVSWRNTIVGDDLKAQYHEAVKAHLNLPMPSRAEEEADPEKAMKMIDQAFERVKGLIRAEDKAGLWSIANADYGFARNLYGCRKLWLILCTIMTGVSAIFLLLRFSNLVLLGFMLNVITLIGCASLGWLILPKLTKQVAFRYAEHAWESFINIAERRKLK
jgi:hypothetical protein